jgi:hypothetical protein
MDCFETVRWFMCIFPVTELPDSHVLSVSSRHVSACTIDCRIGGRKFDILECVFYILFCSTFLNK